VVPDGDVLELCAQAPLTNLRYPPPYAWQRAAARRQGHALLLLLVLPCDSAGAAPPTSLGRFAMTVVVASASNRTRAHVVAPLAHATGVPSVRWRVDLARR